MSIYSCKLLYLLIGLSLGTAILLQGNESSSVPWILVALPVILFAAVWIQNKERVLLAIALVDISLNIDKSFQFQDVFLLSRWGYVISLTSISLAALYGLMLVKSCFYKDSQSRFLSFSKLHIFVICYFVSILMSFVNAHDIYISSFEIFYQFQCLILYFYLVYYINDESKFNYVIQMLLLGLFLQIVVVLIQHTTGAQFDLIVSNEAHDMSSFTYRGDFEVLRPGGTFESYNTLADYLTTLLFIALGYFFSQKSYTGRFLVGACLVLGMATLIMTLSRGAWAGFALGMAVFLMVSLRRRWMTLKAGIAMCTTGVLVMLPFLPQIYLRLTESDAGSGASRIPLAKLAWHIIQDNPLFGVGINNYGVVMQDYLTSEIRGEWLYLVHNKYLLIFAEMGFFGIASYLFLIMGMIWLGYRCVQADHPLLSPLALGMIASTICDAFHMMIDILNARCAVEMFWTMAALTVVAYRLLYLDARRHGHAVATWRPAPHAPTALQRGPAELRS